MGLDSHKCPRESHAPIPTHVNLNQPLQAACANLETSLHNQPQGKQWLQGHHGSPVFPRVVEDETLPPSAATCMHSCGADTLQQMPLTAQGRQPGLLPREAGMRAFDDWLQKAGLVYPSHVLQVSIQAEGRVCIIWHA